MAGSSDKIGESNASSTRMTTCAHKTAICYPKDQQVAIRHPEQIADSSFRRVDAKLCSTNAGEWFTDICSNEKPTSLAKPVSTTGTSQPRETANKPDPSRAFPTWQVAGDNESLGSFVVPDPSIESHLFVHTTEESCTAWAMAADMWFNGGHSSPLPDALIAPLRLRKGLIHELIQTPSRLRVGFASYLDAGGYYDVVEERMFSHQELAHRFDAMNNGATGILFLLSKTGAPHVVNVWKRDNTAVLYDFQERVVSTSLPEFLFWYHDQFHFFETTSFHAKNETLARGKDLWEQTGHPSPRDRRPAEV
ncbi:MAG: hypothetical protein A2289_10880 [Deltaproteobacteria bacterium RIFOXYA12_FULL_58_15]|nr:MAG: hypothetical protein A2289_10880 [Deltaproteobacteria bacterium RIFOXYA12_FULL_58_15]OGR09929.1 MAG: hypothetical protein A2341_27420 [Deltaproteobacteria bacterium RIFOXYB12_FULL_58_9]